jgi:hypothetical protein
MNESKAKQSKGNKRKEKKEINKRKEIKEKLNNLKE